MKAIVIFFLLSVLVLNISKAQETITFKAEDGLLVTADLIEYDENYPYILFFHQAGSSRGEYKETARKFVKLGYNCLVVDLRSGDEINFVDNETAALAKKEGKSTGYLDSEQDIVAAINYIWNKKPIPMVLFGSSYSASLCLKVAKGNEKVKAVIAFSPGEYFAPLYDVKKGLDGFDKKVLVCSSQRENRYSEEMFADVDSSLKKLFSPKGGKGDHGAKALWRSCLQSQEYWLELSFFFQKL